MKYLGFIFIALVAIFLGYFFFVANRDDKENRTPSENPQQQSGFETKTDEQGQVAVKITPQTLGGSQWKFDVAFDTHSGSLDENPTEVIILYNDKGSAHRPTSWEGTGPGGHHRDGILIFEAINPAPPYIELKIKDVGGVPERMFKWNL